MRVVVVVCVLSLAAVAAEPTPKPVTDAIEQLKKAAEKEMDVESKAKIVKAIRYLEASTMSQQDDNAKLADFVDNTEKYQGNTLTFKMIIDGSANVKLEHMKGNLIRLYAYSGMNKLVIMAELPKNIDLPKMLTGDTAVVTLTCEKGHAEQGNIVVSIKRP